MSDLEVIFGESKCQSCGVPYTKHLGIQGTCAALQEAKRLLRLFLETNPSDMTDLLDGVAEFLGEKI